MTMPDSSSVGNPNSAAGENVLALFGAVTDIIRRFGMSNLEPEARVCSGLIGGQATLDVAVLGQFKSGKSSLLNALIGSDLLPIGVTPVTAVVTRLTAGPKLAAHVVHLDGSVENVAIAQIADFATEALNPLNRRRVATVDIATPALNSWPHLRLVDTPGLGSTFAHNTLATREWLPNVAAALVVISADRPLSDDERALIADVRQLVPRMWIVLSKIDLFTSEQQTELVTFLRDRLRECLLHDIPVLRLSVREDREHWISQLREAVFRPLVEDPVRETRAVIEHKLRRLAKACSDYLQIAQRAAVRVAADRERLRLAILDETVRESVIADELALAANRVCADFSKVVSPQFERLFDPIQRRLVEDLRADMGDWRGHLGRQTGAYEVWIREHLTAELLMVSEIGAPLARQLMEQAETRFRRIVEGFRDRLGRNVTKTLNLSLSSVSWDVHAPAVIAPDPSFSRTFDTNWELLWWAIPMPLFGWLFRRHCLGLVPWEVDKNLHRLNSDWYEAVHVAVDGLREQALTWVRTEVATIGQILDRKSGDVPSIEDGIRRLEEALALISSQ